MAYFICLSSVLHQLQSCNMSHDKACNLNWCIWFMCFWGLPADSEKRSYAISDPLKNAAFLPFGSGIRACVGQKFTVLGIASIFASLLERYEVCSLSWLLECIVPIFEVAPTPQKTWNSGFMRLNFYLLPLRTLDRVCIGQEWRMGCVEHRSLVNFCGYWLLIVEFASVRIRVEKMLYILVNWNGDGCKEVTY